MFCTSKKLIPKRHCCSNMLQLLLMDSFLEHIRQRSLCNLLCMDSVGFDRNMPCMSQPQNHCVADQSSLQ